MARWKGFKGVLASGGIVALGAGSAFAQGAVDSVDVLVTHAVVDGSGREVGPAASPRSYRIERVRTDAGWRTTLRYRPTGAARPGVLDAARVEYDENSGRLSIFDAAGAPVSMAASEMPASALLAPGDDVGPLAGIVLRPADRAERRRQLEARFGRASGRVRGLDRFVARDGETTEEVLADPETSAPMEINTARNGRLERQVTFHYEKRAGGMLVRRSMQSEELMPDSDGRRSILVVSFTPADAGR